MRSRATANEHPCAITSPILWRVRSMVDSVCSLAKSTGLRCTAISHAAAKTTLTVFSETATLKPPTVKRADMGTAELCTINKLMGDKDLTCNDRIGSGDFRIGCICCKRKPLKLRAGSKCDHAIVDRDHGCRPVGLLRCFHHFVDEGGQRQEFGRQ